MNYINSYCLIKNRRIIENGRTIFSDESGSIEDFTNSCYRFLGMAYPKFYKMDRLSQLAFLAAEIILKDRKINDRYGSSAVATVLSNANSSTDTDIRYFESVKTAPSPALFVYTLPNIAAGEICIRHGLRGENCFFIFPEFNAGQISVYVDMVMQGKKTDACIAGWADILDDRHDVFLYLAEKEKHPGGLDHTPAALDRIYAANYGEIDGRSQKADH